MLVFMRSVIRCVSKLSDARKMYPNLQLLPAKNDQSRLRKYACISRKSSNTKWDILFVPLFDKNPNFIASLYRRRIILSIPGDLLSATSTHRPLLAQVNTVPVEGSKSSKMLSTLA